VQLLNWSVTAPIALTVLAVYLLGMVSGSTVVAFVGRSIGRIREPIVDRTSEPLGFPTAIGDACVCGRRDAAAQSSLEGSQEITSRSRSINRAEMEAQFDRMARLLMADWGKLN
jgi:hypothetical protein